MRSQKLLIVFVLCLLLSVVVSAHSGGTDSQGGHIDHSTGKYHYHHGYSAHQHYDMDGDGKLDCPHLFDDKTNSSGNHSGSHTISKSPTVETEPSETKNESKKETTKKMTFSDYVDLIVEIIAWIFFGSTLLLCILGGVIDGIRKRRKK